MKRVLIAAIMQVSVTAFSQVDSTSAFKHEISVHTGMSWNGFAAIEYAYWNRPRHSLIIAADFNRVGVPRTDGQKSYGFNDSVLTVTSCTNMITSGGLRIGTGYLLVSSKPSIILSTGIIGGRINRQSLINENTYNLKTDSIMWYSSGSTQQISYIHGVYAGVFGSVTMLADITESLKFSATASLDFCYLFYNKKYPALSELSFREKISLGLRYYF